MARHTSYLRETVDICMACPLPDCDFRHHKCLLRQAMCERNRLYKAGQPVPDHVHGPAMEYHRQWMIEDRARKSEARA